MLQLDSWEEEFRKALKEESVEMGSGSNVLYRMRKLSGLEGALEQNSLKVFVANKEYLGVTPEINASRPSKGSKEAYNDWTRKLNEGSISFSTSKINAFTLHKDQAGARGVIFTFRQEALKQLGTLEPFNWDRITGSRYGDELEFRLVPHKKTDSILMNPASKFLAQVEVFGAAPQEVVADPDLKKLSEFCIINKIPLTIYEKMSSCLMGIARFKEKKQSSIVRALWKGKLFNFSDNLKIIRTDGSLTEPGNFDDMRIVRMFPELLKPETAEQYVSILGEMIARFNTLVYAPVLNDNRLLDELNSRFLRIQKPEIKLTEKDLLFLSDKIQKFYSSEPQIFVLVPNQGVYTFRNEMFDRFPHYTMVRRILQLLTNISIPQQTREPFVPDPELLELQNIVNTSLHELELYKNAETEESKTEQTLIQVIKRLEILILKIVSCAQALQEPGEYLNYFLTHLQNRLGLAIQTIVHEKKYEVLELDMFKSGTLEYLANMSKIIKEPVKQILLKAGLLLQVAEDAKQEMNRDVPCRQ